MPEKCTKEDLLTLGVYELRSLARQVGVKAPTTLTKEEIAEAIVSVIKGEEKPWHSTFGRPVKDSRNFLDALSLLKNEQIPKEEYITPKKILNNFSSVFSSSMIIPTLAEVSFRGYVKLLPEETAIVMAKGYCTEDFENNVIVTKERFREFHLKDGDLIECLAASIGEGKPKIVTDIRSINGISVSDRISRENFKDLASYYPNKRITFAKTREDLTNSNIHEHLLPLGFGARVLMSFEHGADRVATLNKYVKTFIGDNAIHTMVIAIGESPEDLGEIKEKLLDADIIYNDIADENVLELLDVKINHLLREVEQGYDTSIVISNFSLFKNYLKDALKLYNLPEAEASSALNKKLLKIMNLAKNSSTNGSLTVLALTEENIIEPKNEVPFSTINSYLKFNSGYYVNTKISLNLFESYVYKKDKMFTTSENIACNNFFRGLTEETLISNFRTFIK